MQHAFAQFEGQRHPERARRGASQREAKSRVARAVRFLAPEALPEHGKIISVQGGCGVAHFDAILPRPHADRARSEEHTSELSHPSISYAVFCLKKKKKTTKQTFLK